MANSNSFADIQRIIDAVSVASSSDEAAQVFVEWLAEQISPTAVAYLQSDPTQLHLVTSGGFASDQEFLQWLYNDQVWRSWTTVQHVEAGATLENTPLTGPATLVPLRYGKRLYGVVWLECMPEDISILANDAGLILLAGHLAARLHYLRKGGWSAMLAGIGELSRALTSGMGSEEMWDNVHEQMNLLFDTTSFFVGLYDRDHNLLELPLVSEDNVRTLRDPIPLGGISKAVISYGLELQFDDL